MAPPVRALCDLGAGIAKDWAGGKIAGGLFSICNTGWLFVWK